MSLFDLSSTRPNVSVLFFFFFFCGDFWEHTKDLIAENPIKSAPGINTKKRSGGCASKYFGFEKQWFLAIHSISVKCESVTRPR